MKTDACGGGILPSGGELRTYLADRYGDLSRHGWRVKQKWRFGYYAPESWYEAVVERLVTPVTCWIDVGGGKAVFPHSPELSRTLAARCALLVGIDPSQNIERNEFVHERAQCMIEDYVTNHSFDLATLRMVVEHVQQPERAVAKLSQIVRPGGKVVVYTPNRWSLASLAATLTPQSLHARIAGFLWRAREEDVFPTVYKMNTRARLRSLFNQAGFRELAFAHLDSCSILQRFRWLYPVELSCWRGCRMMRVKYPENNLLGVYERDPAR